jgi:glycosyltransferase involved in cell wall biosynthesis
VNGLSYVINLAYEILSIDRTIVFLLVGDGKERDNLISLAKKRGVFDVNLYFYDPISKDELPLLYSSVDMGSSFVIKVPDLWRNSANKYFDTLAAGRPILINYLGWQSDEIDNLNVGYVLPPMLSQKAIADFVDYTRNSSLINQQRLNSHRLAKTHYALELLSSKYISLIQQIV